MNAMNVQALEAVIADRIVAKGNEASAHFSELALKQFNIINAKLQEKFGRKPEELSSQETDTVVAAVSAVSPESITALNIGGVIQPVAESCLEEILHNLTTYDIDNGVAIAFAANLVAVVVNANTNFRLTLAA